MSKDAATFYEGLFKDSYYGKFLDFLIPMKGFEYKESELAKCSRIPENKIPDIVSVFGEYGIIKVTGEEPNRKIEYDKQSPLLDALKIAAMNTILDDK